MYSTAIGRRSIKRFFCFALLTRFRSETDKLKEVLEGLIDQVGKRKTDLCKVSSQAKTLGNTQ